MALTELRHDGGFLLSEAPGDRSRQQVTIENGTGSDVTHEAGTVLARVEGAGTAVAGTNTGTGAMGTITETGDAVPGVYTLKIVRAASNAGDFDVYAPDGSVIGTGKVGVAFSAGGLAFTLADGSTDFIVGDSFAITVTDSGKRVVATATGARASAVLFNTVTVPASGSHLATTIERDAVVDFDELVWGATISSDALKAKARNQLLARGIVAR